MKLQPLVVWVLGISPLTQPFFDTVFRRRRAAAGYRAARRCDCAGNAHGGHGSLGASTQTNR